MLRDFVGYGPTPPKVEWPNGAQIAVSVVVNYEEGAEKSPLYGDDTHETSGEIPSGMPHGARDLFLESQWEYGARVGVWRLLNVLRDCGAHATFFACGMALERNPDLGPAIVAAGHDVCAHGYRWGSQWNMDRAAEKQEISNAAIAIERYTGKRPLSWFSKGGFSAHTRELLAEEGFVYDCDSFNDDIPYYIRVNEKPWLIVPYAVDTNDGKWWINNGWNDGGQFFDYLKDSFDLLYDEGRTNPKMLSVGLHSRVCGRPGRAMAVKRFLEYAMKHPRVWVARRDDIAAWWQEHYPPT